MSLTMQISGATKDELEAVAAQHGWTIDEVGRVAQVTERIMESRKLIGLGLCILGLLVITGMAMVSVVIWGAPWELFTAMAGFITMLGGSHQTAQAAADRSPTYQPLPPVQSTYRNGPPGVP